MSGVWRLVLLLVCLAAIAPAEALADRPFTLRFTDDTTGDITIVANTLMTCPDSHASCANARQGIGSSNLNNNNYSGANAMRRVDADGDPTTFTSSSATLVLAPDATVLFAGLYYGARSTIGSGGSLPPNNTVAGRSTVKFRTPGASAYTTLGPAGTVLDTGARNDFAGFIDVTSLVAAAGAGEYWVADVQSATGEDRYAGWSLVVAFQDTSLPARNLSIFDGLQSVSRTNPVSIPITGFKTPPAGPVRTTIGGAAYEGDRGTPGDVAALNNITGQDDPPGPVVIRPADNFFNSSISRFGTHVSAKTPNFVNQLGFDAALLNATGILQNNATSAVIDLKTSQDVYLPHVVTFATELFAPDVQATKTVANVTNPGGPVARGDTLRYTVTYTNVGQDGAADFKALDPIPAGATYVPGSLRLVTGPGVIGPRTDAADGDTAEFDAANNRVAFRLGSGANAVQGGLIGAAGTSGTSTSYSFEVTVDGDNPDGAEIVNRAHADFFGQSLGIRLAADADVTSIVAAPDLTIAKSHTGPLTGGTTVPFTIRVDNEGALPSDGSTVTVSDTFDAAAFASISVASAPGWSCGVAATTLTCTRSDELPAGSSYPNILVNALVVPSPPATIENTATVAGGGDSDDTNNSSTDVGPGVTEADLQLTKSAQPETVFSGGTVEFTLVVRNGGPSAATDVEVDDPLAPNFAAQRATSTQGTCDTSVNCTIGTLAPGEEATITIEATVVGTGPSHDNTATVTSAVSDPTPGNNSATVTVTVPNTADLSLTKTAAPPNPEAGVADALTYTITVQNHGPAPATNVRVTDPLPADFTPSSVGGGGFTCNLPTTGGRLDCTRATLAVADGPVSITIVGTLPLASAGQVVENTASVEANQGDPDPDNNSDSASTLIAPAADLEVIKTADKNSLPAGKLVRYTIRVTNLGPTEATNVNLTDSFVGDLTVVSASTSLGSCTVGRPVRCSLGTIPAGVFATVTVTVRPLRPGRITDRARVTSDTPDPVPPNSSGRVVTTRVTSGASKISITKRANRDRVGAFDSVKFTIVVRSRGPATARKLEVCDSLPALLTLRRAPGARFRNGSPCWRIRSLNPGAERKFKLTALAERTATTRRVVNRATVKGANVARRSASARVLVRRSPGGDPCLARTQLSFC